MACFWALPCQSSPLLRSRWQCKICVGYSSTTRSYKRPCCQPYSLRSLHSPRLVLVLVFSHWCIALACTRTSPALRAIAHTAHRPQAHRLVRQQLEGDAYRETVQETFAHHPTLAEQHQQAYGFATTAAYRRSGLSRNARATAAALDAAVGRDAFAALSQASSATATPTAASAVTAFAPSPRGVKAEEVAAVLDQQEELQSVVQAAQLSGRAAPAVPAAPRAPAKKTAPTGTDRALSLGKQLSRQASQRAAALAAKGRARLRRGSEKTSRCGGCGV